MNKENETVLQTVTPIAINMEFLKANGITDVKAVKKLEDTLKDLKDDLKKANKGKSALSNEETIKHVDELITKGLLTVGSKIIGRYKDREVVCYLRTVPTLKSKNLSVEGSDFDNKEGRVYLVKSKFLGFADEVVEPKVEVVKATLIKASDLKPSDVPNIVVDAN